MRRSRSLTSIPVRKDSRGKERARSTLRISGTPKNPVTTPLSRRLLGEPISSRRGTSPFGSRGGSSFGVSPAGPKITTKTLSNKKWLADQFSYIQEFIRKSGLFEPQLASNIKPPQINTFVLIISILIKQIFPAINLNTHNYAEVLVSYLRLLRYPGSITISGVKCVNTMHGWPLFVAITSWLCGKVSIVLDEELDLKYVDDISKENYDLMQATTQYYNSNYAEWTKQQDILEDNTKQWIVSDIEKFQQELLVITGLDSEVLGKSNAEIKACEDEIIKAEAEAEQEHIKALNIQMDAQYKQEFIKFCQSDEVDKNIELNMAQVKEELEKYQNIKKEIKKKCENLQAETASKPYKYSDKVEILNEIEERKRAEKRMNQNLSEFLTVRDDLDRKLANMVGEIEKEVDSWNAAVIKTLLPNLEDIKLRDKGFHSHQFLEELHQCQQKYSDLEKKIQEEKRDLKVKIEEYRRHKKEMLSYNKEAEELLKKKEDNETIGREVEEEITNITKTMDEAKENHELNMKQLSDSFQSKWVQTKSEVAEAQAKLSSTQIELSDAKKAVIALMIKAHASASDAIAKAKEIMEQVTLNLKNSTEDLEAELKEKSEYLEKLRANFADILPQMNNLQDEFDNFLKKYQEEI